MDWDSLVDILQPQTKFDKDFNVLNKNDVELMADDLFQGIVNSGIFSDKNIEGWNEKQLNRRLSQFVHSTYNVSNYQKSQNNLEFIEGVSNQFSPRYVSFV